MNPRPAVYKTAALPLSYASGTYESFIGSSGTVLTTDKFPIIFIMTVRAAPALRFAKDWHRLVRSLSYASEMLHSESVYPLKA